MSEFSETDFWARAEEQLGEPDVSDLPDYNKMPVSDLLALVSSLGEKLMDDRSAKEQRTPEEMDTFNMYLGAKEALMRKLNGR